MPKRVFVVGVGMTKFLKPSDNNPDYPILAKTAVQRALMDAGINYKKIEMAAVGYVFGDSTSGQRALYEVGMSGIPVYNVNNNCSTGSSALHLANNMIAGGMYNCALALGFQKMERGSLQMKYPDRTNPLDKCYIKSEQLCHVQGNPPFAPKLFGNAGMEHIKQFGTKPQHFAKIAAKNHRHSLNNPYSQFQKGYSKQQIQKSPKIHAMLTKLQCCPTSDGAGAAILCDEQTMLQLGLQDQAVEIKAIEMTTDTPKMFDNSKELVGYSMTKMAAEKVYKKTGITPKEIGVVELHDCFSANQLLTYEGLGLCEQGKAAQFIDRNDNTYGGRVVVNPSGGLISKGHPLGATGLAQCCQLNWQLRNLSEKRQVIGVKYALQHNLGLGGACVVVLYEKYNHNKSKGTSNLQQIQAIQKSMQKSIQSKL